jgi:hypothetical protein
MLEPSRSRYLAALGIDVYVPRVVLPGAGASVLCEWDEQALAETAEPAGIPELLGKTFGAALEPNPVASIPAPVLAGEQKPVRPAPARDVQRTEQPVPRFALSIVLAANGVLLIDDAPASSAVRNDYQRLLGNFLNAVNKDGQFVLDLFAWPLRNSPPIVQGEAAAKETLAAHLYKQIQQRGIKTVLLLGESAQRWVCLESPELNCIRSNSLLGCLRDPSLKRQLWHDVRGMAAG